MTTPLVIQAEDLDPQPAAWLAERCDLVPCRYDDPAFSATLARADGLIVRTYTQVTKDLLNAAPRLRVVARAGVGVDNIDLAACWGRGVVVVNTPGANTRAVVEFVMASVLDALRPRVFLHQAIDTPEWNAARKRLEAPLQVADATVGILGLGRIGAQVARAFGALDATVIYHDLREIEPAARAGATPVPRDDLLERSDILTVHVDGRRSNYHTVGADAFAQMKPGVVFVNSSRGFVVDPVACAGFFVDYPEATAILDVHDPEPVVETSPLIDIKNVHLSPHIAGATQAAKREMSWVVRDVWRVLSGQAPEHPAMPDTEA